MYISLVISRRHRICRLSIEAMSSNAKAGSIIALYLLILCASLVAYIHFIRIREDLKFWIPQAFLLILIAVTTLYVFYTADLVRETRQLQQRPLIQVTFEELAELPTLRFERLFEYAQGLSQEMLKVLGGEQLAPAAKYVTIKLKNIGQTTVRSFAVTVSGIGPEGQMEPEERMFTSEIEKDNTVRIAVAPSLPFLVLEVQDIVYGDGFRKYTDISGNRIFNSSLRAGAPEAAAPKG